MYQIVQLGDYLGTLVFAITGGLAAAEKRLDFGGFFLLAFATGVGGGTVRDLILNRDGVFWTEQPLYVALCLVGAIAAFFYVARRDRLHRALVWADAVGLAVFAVIGAGVAIQEQAPPVIAVLMGALTATGGGVIRDIIRNEVPLVLHREIYVLAAVAGAATVVVLHTLGAPPWVSIIAGAAIAFVLRASGILLDLHLPVYTPPRARAETLRDDAAADA